MPLQLAKGSRLRNVVAAIVGGAIAGTVEYVVHTTVMEVRLPPGVPTRVDAAIVASITGVLLYLVLREWRLRREHLLKQLSLVAELNHNVRNALQMLLYSRYLPPHEQTEAVLQCVNRIDRTLKDLFPGIGPQDSSANVQPAAKSTSRSDKEEGGQQHRWSS